MLDISFLLGYKLVVDLYMNSDPKVGIAMLMEQNELQDTAKGKKKIGEGVKFERIRRITGYLVGTLDRFNNAKRDEEHDRVKHG